MGDSFELPLSSAITGLIKSFQIIDVSHTFLRQLQNRKYATLWLLEGWVWLVTYSTVSCLFLWNGMRGKGEETGWRIYLLQNEISIKERMNIEHLRLVQCQCCLSSLFTYIPSFHFRVTVF